ncbi:MAG: hypothetical protein FJ144_13995 [Deltaproteobacteria bacterium]|nr:hypothetical protein [Deltaproteobacteria bacterium]
MRPGATLCSHCLATRTVGLTSFTGLVVLLWFVAIVAGASFVGAAAHLKPILGGTAIGCLLILAVLFGTRRSRVRYVRKK